MVLPCNLALMHQMSEFAPLELGVFCSTNANFGLSEVVPTAGLSCLHVVIVYGSAHLQWNADFVEVCSK